MFAKHMTSRFFLIACLVCFQSKSLYGIENERINWNQEETERLLRFNHKDVINIEWNTNEIYPPTWEALDKRPLPRWFAGAKFGVIMLWGVYSVPSMMNEWFWLEWRGGYTPAVEFMKKNYKPDFTYPDFAPQLTAEFLNASAWATFFKQCGVQYVIFSSKHHDGFANWPSKYSFNWNAKAVGPKRDVVGEVVDALRKNDLKVGLYYSLYEWFHPLYLLDKGNNYKTQEFISKKMMPELMDLVNLYKPDILWSDGDWEASYKYWNSTGFLSWLYSYSPVKDTVITNDRWGIDAECVYGGYKSCKDRYRPGKIQDRPFETVWSLDKTTYSFRRNVRLEDFYTMEENLAVFAETLSCGGNFMVGVPPSYDGSIQPIYQEIMTNFGQWLKVNSEAIYGSFPWIYQKDTVTPRVWYTEQQTGETRVVYAIVLDWPAKNYLYLGAPKAMDKKTSVRLLGTEISMAWTSPRQGGINITIPVITYDKLPCKWAWVFRLSDLYNA